MAGAGSRGSQQTVNGALPIPPRQVGRALQSQASALPAAGATGFIGGQFMVVQLVVGKGLASGVTTERAFHTVGGNGQSIDEVN